jgi:hypothetical protein
MTILSIRRNWRPEDETRQKRNHFVHYGYVPGFGFYCFGLIHLVGAFAKSGTSLIRQLVDAGTLSNLPGGFKTRGLRVKGDDTPIAPGEFRDVDVPSGAIKDNLMTLPYKEPSQVLYSLLGTIVEEGRRFASAGDMKVSDMSANAPVGTTLAILERTLKVMSAVQSRIHYSMKQELKLLKEIIRDYTPDVYPYEPVEGSRKAKKSDYDHVDVIPVSDPNAATMAQKIVQYQAVLQLAQGAPQIYNLPQLHRQMLDVLGIRNAQKLIPLEDDQKPTDPIRENMNVMIGKPLKAFIRQDQDAHLAAHQAFLQDPQAMAIIGQKPMAHQIETASFLTLNKKAFVFSEPGTGKTLSALWAADYLMDRGDVRRCLILCPLSIMQSAWLNDLNNSIIHRSAIIAHHYQAARRIEMVQQNYEFVIANYDGLNLIADEINNDGRFDLVIVDEANAYKTMSTKRW